MPHDDKGRFTSSAERDDRGVKVREVRIIRCSHVDLLPLGRHVQFDVLSHRIDLCQSCFSRFAFEVGKNIIQLTSERSDLQFDIRNYGVLCPACERRTTGNFYYVVKVEFETSKKYNSKTKKYEDEPIREGPREHYKLMCERCYETRERSAIFLKGKDIYASENMDKLIRNVFPEAEKTEEFYTMVPTKVLKKMLGAIEEQYRKAPEQLEEKGDNDGEETIKGMEEKE